MISVGIPTVDRPHQLRECVASVLAGTSLPREVIVLDQSSDDATRAVVESFGSEILRYVCGRAHGVGAARNRLLDLAQSEYVALIDDDVTVPPQWLGTLRSKIEQLGHPDAVFGEVRVEELIDPKLIQANSYRIDRERVWKRRVHPYRLGISANMAVRRAPIMALGGFDERLGPGTALHGGEDMDLNFRILKARMKVVSSPDWWVEHHPDLAPDQFPAYYYRYSLGGAALCVKLVREGEWRGAWMLVVQVLADLKMLASALRRRSVLRARVAISRAAGTWRGVVAGWRVFAS